MALISSDYFTVNGISSETVGLWVDTPPAPPMASQRVTVWGGMQDFDLSAPDDVWDDITLTVQAYTFFNDDFDLSAVYAFLADARTLGLSRFPGKHLRVRSVKQIAPKVQYDGARISVPITFVCKPFKYLDDNPETAVTGNTVTNRGTRFCRPVWHVQGASGTVLTVNGEAFTVTGAAWSEYYIDSERLMAYAPNGDSILMQTAGNFPFLRPGTNSVSLSAGTLAVRLNERWY